MLASCTLLGLGVALCARAADGGASPREWLERMDSALATRNYDGTFMHVSDGRVETMRIVHQVRPGRVTERLLSLDGSGREFVRNNEELTCYLPDRNQILVEPRQAHGPFIGTLPKPGGTMDQSYELVTLPEGRVLGRTVHGIAVNPRDQFRFGYRLWLDEQTAMPLKSQLFDASGRVIEQIQFAHLDMPDSIPDSALVPSIPLTGMQVVRHGTQDEAPATAGAFRAIELPPGFQLTMAGKRVLAGGGEPVLHLVYSDGLATVSVFVESGQAPGSAPPPGPGLRASVSAGGPPPQVEVMHESLARVGSGFAFSTVVQGHEVTAIGEVPAQTVEFIARSVRANSADTAAH